MREMVAKQGDEWLRQGDGWQSREMVGLVGSPLLALRVRIQTSLKI
jgi:hypothetical protein